MEEKILVLDFGGQYNQLIARRVREQNVYCEIKPYTMTMEEIREFAPMGIIFTVALTSLSESCASSKSSPVYFLYVVERSRGVILHSIP